MNIMQQPDKFHLFFALAKQQFFPKVIGKAFYDRRFFLWVVS
jgi:hypothetical protein